MTDAIQTPPADAAPIQQSVPIKPKKRRGRPPKPIEFLTPSQLRRTLLSILDEKVEVSTLQGIRQISTFETIIRNLVALAAKGNPTALNHLMKLLIPALEERVDAHRQVQCVEYIREQMEAPNPDPPKELRRYLLDQIDYAKDKY